MDPHRSYDRMLSTTGNTAVYLQFAHARLASIVRKAEEEKNVDMAALRTSPEKLVVEHDAERGLAFELLMFSDVVEVKRLVFTVRTCVRSVHSCCFSTLSVL